MNTSQPPSRVVVMGRDVDLWLSVTAIRKALAPAGVDVFAIELPTRLRPSDISATLPPLEAFHAKLGITEPSFIRATDGSFSLGQNFVAGSHGGLPSHFFHAWGAYGAPIDGSAFFHCWLKATRYGLKLPFEDFCLNAVAAKSGRMLLPDEATSAFGRTDYGYHMNTMAYAGYLKSLAATLGVKQYEAQGALVERDATGSIVALLIDGSLRVEGELFVDATGPEALLIGRSLEVPSANWRQYFNVDRVLSARAPAFTKTPSFAEIRVSDVGWTALHPNQAITHILQVYSSELLSNDAALEAASAAAAAKLIELSFHAVNPCLRSRVWEGNCVAVGESACVLDPLHDVAVHALQLGLVHLLSLFPVTGQFAVERTEYNRLMRSYYERLRDFQCAFYALAPFRGEFWRQARGRSLPQALSHKIASFRARGLIVPMEDETFLPDSWQALFTGLGVAPESWPPAVDRMPPNRFREEFHRAIEFIKRKVAEQPTHDGYLDSLGRSSAA
jgi:tryptophan halogenase